MPTRRTVLKLAAAPLLLGRAPLVRAAASRVVVVGAGAFGGWTALWLARKGAQVTLVDAWGPGNMRASSGGETRVIRGSYGDRAIYTRMAARALRLWAEHEREWGRQFYFPTGALWMFGRDDAFARASVKAMASEGLPAERPSVEDARRRWPQIDFNGIGSVMFEPQAGYLLARQSCAHVVERARALGAAYRVAAARPVEASKAMSSLALEGGGSLEGDAFVFACGPWLGRMVPGVIGERIRPTRQSTFYFGTPAGDATFHERTLPVWVDYRERLIYGIPGNAHRGFKLADDTLGADFDPTSGERAITEAEVADARAFLRQRFPALARQPFLGGEVCQYENSPDSHFIVDRHPAASNVWIVGGGSGHGFKMGPALGEMVADLVLSDGTADPQLRLSRFAK
jgi:monomeric sarcosine oxidase